MADNEKLVGVLSYITIIGWIIAYLLKTNNNNGLGRFHLRQALLLGLIGVAVSLLTGVIGWFVAQILHLIVFIFAVIGIIGAINGQKKELPLVGAKSQEWFKGL